MYKAQLAAVVLITVFSTIHALIAPAGKCNLYQVEVVPLDFDRLEKIPNWEYLCATDAEPFRQIDTEKVDLTTIGGGGRNYKTHDTKVMKDKTKSTNKSKYKVEQNIGFESSRDDKGQLKNFRIYPLATTESDAVLFYRCADDGTAEIDTRYIIIPAGRNITDGELETVYLVDKKYPFRGPLYKLPRQNE